MESVKELEGDTGMEEAWPCGHERHERFDGMCPGGL